MKFTSSKGNNCQVNKYNHDECYKENYKVQQKHITRKLNLLWEDQGRFLLESELKLKPRR